jgi:PAS domain S-box-containing protein
LVGLPKNNPDKLKRAPALNSLKDESFQEIADHAPVMLWRISPDFKCDWVNVEWLKYTGGSFEQQCGFAWLRYLHPDDAERTAEHFDLAFEARKPACIEFRLLGADGEYRWFVDRGVPFYRDGTFSGFIGSCIDIHDRKRAEALVQELRTQIATARR